MLRDQIEQAVNQLIVISFVYDGKVRIVEPHALGTNKNDELILRGYQTDGESATNPVSWKLFTVSKIENFAICPDFKSHAPRAGYKADDKAMITILAQLPERVVEEV